MNTIALLFCLSCSVHSKAQQNLVPNGDFEEYKVMPKSFTPFYVEDNRYYFEDVIREWYSPTNGTPDFFLFTNENINSVVNNPIIWNKSFGLDTSEYFSDSSNNAFIGLASALNIKNMFKINFLAQEFIQVQLKSKLIKGRKYDFKLDFRISIISNSNFPKLGVCFSTGSLLNFYNTSINNPYFTRFNPPISDYQLVNESADTIWTEFTYQFRASKEERFLTIGCFNLENHPFKNDTNIYAYYFIDKVSLVEIPCLVGQDTACSGEEVTFYSTFAGPFEWYYNEVLMSTDSIIQFAAQEGWYHLKTPQGEDSVYLYVVQDLPQFEDIQKQICEGEVAEFQLPAQFTYHWLDGSQEHQRNFVSPTNQWVAVSSKYCNDTFRVAVKVQPIPDIEIQKSFQFCSDSTLGIEVYLPSAYQYLWMDGHSGSYRLLTKEGVYPLNIFDSLECNSSDTITVAERCPMKIFMPNAFAPQGLNNVFKPLMSGVDKATLVIFNRWGEKVFEQTANLPSWDGTYQGQKSMQGVYHYQLSVYQNNKMQYYSGVVHLVR